MCKSAYNVNNVIVGDIEMLFFIIITHIIIHAHYMYTTCISMNVKNNFGE